jgi:hypothetical protein
MGSGYDIARAIQRCVQFGRDEGDCWKSTPKQLSAWCELIDREEAARDARLLGLMRGAAHGENRSVKEIMKKLEENGR